MENKNFTEQYFFSLPDLNELLKEKIYNGKKVTKETTKENIHLLLDYIKVARPEYYATLYKELALQIDLLVELYEGKK